MLVLFCHNNAYFDPKQVKLEDQEYLLQEKEAELADLHRVWEIPYSSLKKVRRIDLNVSGAYGEVREKGFDVGV